jgi:hypothetical protein
MSSHRQIFFALAAAAVLVATVAADQAKPTPPAPTAPRPNDEGAAARPRLTAAFRGQAEVLVTRPVSKRNGKLIVTTMRVQNKANAPLAGLTVDEFWYGKGGDPVTGGKFRNPKPLLPNEVIDVVIETPSVPDMDRNSYTFKHANGTVKTTNVAKIEMPKVPKSKS